jgi:hypothetical protein
MSVTVSEFRDQVPPFEEIEQGATLAVNGTKYAITEKETRSPGPGESTHYLYLDGTADRRVVSWSPGHTVESVWIYDAGADPMTEAEEVDSVAYSPE